MNYIKTHKISAVIIKSVTRHFSIKSHNVLGVAVGSGREQIKEAYYGLCKIHHPDHNEGRHTDKYIEIQNAYTELINITEKVSSTPRLTLDEILNKVQDIQYQQPLKKESFESKCLYYNNNSQFNDIDLVMLRRKYFKLKISRNPQIKSFSKSIGNSIKAESVQHFKTDAGLIQQEILSNKFIQGIYYSSIKGISLFAFCSFTAMSIPLEFSIPINLYIIYLVIKKF
jgi:curved DNA-binding protein CbpA